MSDNEHEQPNKMPRLIIDLLPGGINVGVRGPVGNIGLCYFMLERAKDAVRELAKPRLVIPQGPQLPPDDFMKRP